MSRKIDYGIDLGTTNSAIARMEHGVPTIKKSDTLKDTIPSCVGFNKKGNVLVGDGAWNMLKSDKLKAMRNWDASSYNTFIEFKRTMGTDKSYHSSNMGRAFNSEELSAEVLKKLRSFITDEEVGAVVVTVPAKFEIRQKDATLRAAKLAGFQHCELLQEPIAASMAYGLESASKNGYWVVFDFSDTTFDAALVRVEDGIMQVKDTDGDNYLGGKNLDMAIVDGIIIPYLESNYAMDGIMGDPVKRQILQEAMKYYAEEAKIQLSFKEEHNILSDLGDIPGEDDDGESFELDITVRQADLRRVLAPIFQKAIDITHDLLARNNLKGEQLDALILVGGPTYSPILRQMLADQVRKPDTSADPMTAVAVGAALYASTIGVSEALVEASRDRGKVQLDLGYEPSTVEPTEFLAIKILADKSEGKLPAQVYAELTRGDKGWSSGKVPINTKGEIIELHLQEGRPNSFDISLYDGSGNRYPCQPDRVSIIQGTKLGSATLPYNIGVGVKRRRDGRVLFESAKGLEMNATLPAKGVINGLKTQQALRPGQAEDFIRVPIYQGDFYSEGSRAFYNEHVYDAIISGEDFPALLPEGSDVDLTLFTDKSGRIERMEAFFPYLDHTAVVPVPEDVGKEIGADFLDKEMGGARHTLGRLRREGLVDGQALSGLERDLDDLEERLGQGRRDYDRKREVLEGLRKCLRKLDQLEEGVEWPKLEAELREEYAKLEQANKELGDEDSAKLVQHIRKQLDEVIRKRDVPTGQGLLEEIRQLFVGLTMIYQLIGFVRHYSKNFSAFNWSNPQAARQRIKQAEDIIATNPSTERLHPIVVDLIRMLPPDEQGDNNVLTR